MFWVCICFLVGVFVGTQINGKTLSDEEILNRIDHYLYLNKYELPYLTLTENITLLEIRNLYEMYGNYPYADTLMIKTWRMVCE